MDRVASVLIEELKLAVDLYKHEDTLNWNKFRHGLYGIFLLSTAYWYAQKEGMLVIVAFIAILGTVASVVFLVTLYNGLTYVQERSECVRRAETALQNVTLIDIRIGCPLYGLSWKTMKLMFYLTNVLTILFWLKLVWTSRQTLYQMVF